MSELVITLLENIKSSDWLSSVAIIFLLACFSYRPVRELLREHKQNKSKLLKQALDCEVIKGMEKEYIRSLMVKEQFGLATGLWADEKFRQLAVKIDLDKEVNISMRQIVLAKEHLEISEECNSFAIKLTKGERLKSRLDDIFGKACLFIGICLILLSLVSFVFIGWQSVAFLLLGVYLIFIAFFSAALSKPASIAQQIEPELEKLYNKLLKSDS
ncbi:hypothetical protein [Vibrio furnissii]|uniref:hypothetical protein n=1 Tax=Vibrio furnissii TaxID=29494 RepID=UPI0015587DF6|nr:hypothetical protein [Vibrio furnissii]